MAQYVFRMTIDGRHHDLDLDQMSVAEAEECEAKTGWTTAEWVTNLLDGRARAVKFALWLTRQRDFDGGSVDWNSDSLSQFSMGDVEWVDVDPDADADAGDGEPGPTGDNPTGSG